MARKDRVAIRPYESGDLDSLIEIFLRAVREVAAADYSPAQIEAWARVDRDAWAARRLDRPTWVATAGGAPVGFTDLEADGHLDMMYVHPGHRGMGVAKRLLDRVEREARARKLPRLHAEVSITARPFFERQGFRVIEEERVLRNGAWFLRHRMEKTVA